MYVPSFEGPRVTEFHVRTGVDRIPNSLHRQRAWRFHESSEYVPNCVCHFEDFTFVVPSDLEDCCRPQLRRSKVAVSIYLGESYLLASVSDQRISRLRGTSKNRGMKHLEFDMLWRSCREAYCSEL